ncbi:MAG TPA: hypothetical protein VGE30_00580 [Candidatus Saccharimonadales bacterium]
MNNEELIKKLSRQVRVLNVFLVFFSLIFLAVLGVVGFTAYQAKQQVDKAQVTLTELSDSASKNLDLRDDLCATSGSLGSLIRSQTDLCQDTN